MNLFIEKKIVEAITIEGTEIRYDLYDPNSHGHFKCEECGEVYDIKLDWNTLEIPDLEGFEVKEQYIHFKGICAKCKK